MPLNDLPPSYRSSELLTKEGKPRIIALFLAAEIGRRQLVENERFPINEDHLSKSLGVSRHTVNLAWRDLEANGVVEIQPGHGVVMRDPGLLFDNLSIDVSFRIRQEAEKELMRLATKKVSSGDLKVIRKALDELSVVSGKYASKFSDEIPHKAYEVFRSDLHFHGVIHRIAKDPWLTMIAEIAEARTYPMWYGGLQSPDAILDFVNIHKAIYASIKSRDINAVNSSIDRHFDHARYWGKKALKNHPKTDYNQEL